MKLRCADLRGYLTIDMQFLMQAIQNNVENSKEFYKWVFDYIDDNTLADELIKRGYTIKKNNDD